MKSKIEPNSEELEDKFWSITAPEANKQLVLIAKIAWIFNILLATGNIR